ncbi:DNA polymerase subunit gamma-2, mitochondrial [Lycorma delicatula]|uniref:DNA polymerase subunit gamma-2, mitochondrial n=1 Tax=Lycorma delicatula TaxID=130591 RepID=UPI003F5144E7
MQKLQKILELCKLNGFFKAINLSHVKEKCPNYFHFGPAGELLVQNIQREWIFSNVTAREPSSIFQHYSPGTVDNVLRLKDAYLSSKSLTNGHLPFGLVEVRGDKNLNKSDNESNNFDFLPAICHQLLYYAFISPQEGPQFFYRWQQHRQMWWRKFSMDPGRFSLTETKNDKEGKVEIKAKFPWGLITIESIRNHSTEFFSALPSTDVIDFEVMDGRKKCLPYVIESYSTVEAAAFTFLCDGFLESETLDIPKQQFRLHRKLAPFKISFVASPTTSQSFEELLDLATYLSQELRRFGIITLIPQMKQSLDSQLTRCDSLAVPYTIILNPSTLVTGLAALRSQQTSLQEEVHISNIVNYVEQLMKNY